MHISIFLLHKESGTRTLGAAYRQRLLAENKITLEGVDGDEEANTVTYHYVPFKES